MNIFGLVTTLIAGWYLSIASLSSYRVLSTAYLSLPAAYLSSPVIHVPAPSFVAGEYLSPSDDRKQKPTC